MDEEAAVTRSVEIPPETVERAAHALWARDHDTPWELGPLHELLEYRDSARAALDAAALPYLAPAGDGGLREELEKLIQRYRRWTSHRAIADNLERLLAAHPPQPACLGDGVCTNLRCATHGMTAVPQPVDREALRRLLFDWIGGSGVDEGALADAVLALLKDQR